VSRVSYGVVGAGAAELPGIKREIHNDRVQSPLPIHRNSLMTADDGIREGETRGAVEFPAEFRNVVARHTKHKVCKSPVRASKVKGE